MSPEIKNYISSQQKINILNNSCPSGWLRGMKTISVCSYMFDLVFVISTAFQLPNGVLLSYTYFLTAITGAKTFFVSNCQPPILKLLLGVVFATSSVPRSGLRLKVKTYIPDSDVKMFITITVYYCRHI